MSGNNVNLMMGGSAPPVATSPSGSFNPVGNTLPGPVTETTAKSWFEAMAKAWGQILDKQAQEITDLSSQIGDGGQDQPSTLTLLTAASLKMQFMATNSATSINATGQAQDTLARKQ
ncbi:MAG: hypothetical protein ABI843_07230 [Dokdonella sp.]